MKKTLITAIISCSSIAGMAQLVIKKNTMPVTNQSISPLYQPSRIIGKTQKGTVYALPQDGMPALRPDTSLAYNMPVRILKPGISVIAYPKLPQPNPLLPKKQKEALQIITPDGVKPIKIR